MVGFIFTELIEMVEERYGYEVIDRVILSLDLDSNGVYTSVKSYPDCEYFQLIDQLANEVGVDDESLQLDFGKFLFKSSLRRFAPILMDVDDSIGFFKTMHHHLNTNFSKIYPNDDFGLIKIKPEKEYLSIYYRNDNKMSFMIEGVIKGACTHYHRDIEILKEFEKGRRGDVNFKLKLPKL